MKYMGELLPEEIFHMYVVEEEEICIQLNKQKAATSWVIWLERLQEWDNIVKSGGYRNQFAFFLNIEFLVQNTIIASKQKTDCKTVERQIRKSLFTFRLPGLNVTI